jgi:hypothetical protein
MPGSIFTSRILRFTVLAALLGLMVGATAARAESPPPNKDSKTLIPEEDDFSETPFTEYGEFNEEADEAADTKFFQYGRFFGASLGIGFEGISGNRGLLWQGGFPTVDFKLHYWFDFNVALDLGFFTTKHFFEVPGGSNPGTFDVSIFYVGLAAKYYFDTKNLSAAISFANPYVKLGFGSFTKSELNPLSEDAAEVDNAISVSGGAGLEFAIKPRKVYVSVEGNVFFPRFVDTTTTRFQSSNSLQDLEGLFYTATASILFTW